jgi:hypothetical protein
MLSSRHLPSVPYARLVLPHMAIWAFLATYALVGAGSALAAGPASVTVRVLGPGPAYEPIVPVTQVTTNEAPVVKDGNPAHACAGTSAAGALQLATGGNWNGPWSEGFHEYEVETIEGRSFPFEPSAATNYFWSFWLNDQLATTGVCEAMLSNGEGVVLFPECFSETNACPTAPSLLSVGTEPTVEVGHPVTVKVLSHSNLGGSPSPVAGATVIGTAVGDPPTSATTDASGEATLTFPSDGLYTLRATTPSGGAPVVPGEGLVCVHNGNDGTCGTHAPSSAAGQGSASGGVLGFSTASYTGPYAIVAKAVGLIDGHVYGRDKAPRVLAGSVIAHTTVTSVSLELRRRFRGHCYAYNGTREELLPARCGKGSFFKVATQPSFSYLLPRSLPPGRYVLDIRATDALGDHTTLARGTSRIVFYVAARRSG